MALIGSMSGSHTALTDGSPAFITSDTDTVKVSTGGTIVQRTQYVDKAQFGDKSDGSPTLDGVNSFSWAALSGVIYTMNRDAFFNDLTLTNTAILSPKGFMPYIAGTLTISAGCSMENRGNSAAGSVAGTAQQNFGTWYSDSGAGAVGITSSGNAAGNPASGTSNAVGAAGGQGGAAGVNLGGAGGAITAPSEIMSAWRTLFMLLNKRMFSATSTISTLKSAGGGGSGGVTGGGSNGTSGGGGGGAMNLYFIANVLNNAGTISSVGGAGGNASIVSSANAGGGGGGGGGIVLCAINSVTALGTIVSTGGTGGTGAGSTGTTGLIGASGPVVILTGSI